MAPQPRKVSQAEISSPNQLDHGASHISGHIAGKNHDADKTAGASRSTTEEPGFGLFIRNMVFEANEDHLKEAYEKYGEIVKVAIARDARGLSRG